MAKKFFDIIPPQKSSAETGSPQARILIKKDLKKKDKYGLEPHRHPYKERTYRIFRNRRFLLKSFVLSSLILILIGLSGFFFFSKAKIDIWPEAETLNFEEEVTIDSNYDQFKPAIWVEEGIIPGKIFSDEKFSSQEFFASGKTLKEEKARGIIRVYNAYSTFSQALLANTRFVSTEGKLFRSVKREIIPGGRYEKGNLVSGYTDIEVQAAEPGEEYNIGPSTFSIPGFAGTPRYTNFYGKSFAPMTGGFKGEVPQVTKEDLERAENTLAGKLKKESRDFLKAALPLDFVLLDEAISQEVIESSASLEAGTKTESFDYQVRISSKGVGFKNTDIEKFTKSFISLNTPEGKKFQEESLEINYSPESVNVKSGKIVLNLKIRAKIYSDINLIELKKALLGKSFKEVKIFLGNHSQITKIELKSWPIWRKKIPENLDKVELKLRID